MVQRETGKNCLCKTLEGQTKSIMVFLILANYRKKYFAQKRANMHWLLDYGQQEDSN